MPERMIATLTIGLLAAASFLFTVYLVEVPIWVLFIGWASYVAAGGGRTGVTRSLPMVLLGVLSAAATLSVAAAFGAGPAITALCLIVGAGVLVALGALPALSFTPGAFLGYASTVGVMAVSGREAVSWPIFSTPALVVAAALSIGTAFGFIADALISGVNRALPATEVAHGDR